MLFLYLKKNHTKNKENRLLLKEMKKEMRSIKMTQLNLKKRNTLNVDLMQEMDLELNLTKNSFDLEIGSLFQIAARKNPKRHFLFASTVVGKYITVDPKLPIVTSLLLAHLFLKEVEKESPYDETVLSSAINDHSQLKKAYSELKKKKNALTKKTAFIAFAEAATGLGQGVFHGVGNNSSFIHTSRDRNINLSSVFDFEEEHSHATNHHCYDKEDQIKEAERVVLIDDEITTGKTALNLIQALHEKTPKKEYVVLTILDWRRPFEIESFSLLEKKLGIKIHVLSLLSGTMDYKNTPFEFRETKNKYIEKNQISCKTLILPSLETSILNIDQKNHYHLSGKFGIKHEDKIVIEAESKKIAERLNRERKVEKTLFLGYGEFLFLPNLVAAKMGEGVFYHSIARSPIYQSLRENYPVKDRIDIYDQNFSVKMFLYNVIPGSFEEVFILSEHNLNDKNKKRLESELSKRGVSFVHFISLFKEDK